MSLLKKKEKKAANHKVLGGQAHIRRRHCAHFSSPACSSRSAWAFPLSSFPLRVLPWRWTRPPSCWGRAESSVQPATSGSTASRWGSTASSRKSSVSCGWSRRPTSAAIWSASWSPKRLLWHSCWTSMIRGWRTKTTQPRRPSSQWQQRVNKQTTEGFIPKIKRRSKIGYCWGANGQTDLSYDFKAVNVYMIWCLYLY